MLLREKIEEKICSACGLHLYFPTGMHSLRATRISTRLGQRWYPVARCHVFLKVLAILGSM